VRMLGYGMADEKPNPLSDTLKGLGLLLRAAKTVVGRLPTKNLEETVVESAREVGRAIENVATAVEREVLGRKNDPRDVPRTPNADGKAKESPESKSDEPKKP
jgi:hypothetical protein